MSGGEVDAAGTLAAGTLVAAQFDAPAAADADSHSGACANCGAAVAGHFCANCGQRTHVARSIGHIFHDLLHGLLHFDSKGWRTLPMLFFRPGRLTREYVEGKRARYVAPFAMFLFSVFVMYFSFAMMGAPSLPPGAIRVDAAGLESARNDLAEERAGIDAARRALANATADERRELERQIRARSAALAVAERAIAPAGPGTDDGSYVDLRGALERAGEDPAAISISGAPNLERRIRSAVKNPDLVFYKMQQSAYKFSFLLVPLSLPFVWLLFPFRRDLRLYDHSVFTLYSLAFMTLMFILLAVAVQSGILTIDSAMTAGLLIPPVHIFMQLKGAYRLGVPGALFRTLLLSLFAVVVLMIFFAIVLALGVI